MVTEGPAGHRSNRQRQWSRRRGHGRALIEALEALARGRACAGRFVFVDDDNEAGRAAYRSAGGTEDSRPHMVDWSFVSV